MSYKYLLYGLKVESELEIEEAYVQGFEGEADVRVICGKLPEEVIDTCAEKSIDEEFAVASADALIFRVPNLADYWVTRDAITVSPFEGAERRGIKSFVLGSCFGYCMFLRRQVLLHGGAVSKNGKGAIITGDSGAGKSTVTDALLDKGYKFVADDTCSITDSNDKLHINMAYPQQKLCKDAAISKGYDLSELIFIDEGRDKYAKRLKSGFLADGIGFDYLFELAISEDDKLSFKEVTGHEKLKLILRNVYRGEDSFRLWGVPPEYMMKCLEIASAVSIYRIKRPSNTNTLQEIIEFIDTKLQ